MTELDPKARQFLDMLDALQQPPLTEITPEQFRADRAQGRDLITLPSPDLEVVRDIKVAGAEGPLKARLYDVEDGAGRPTLIYFHGGGFVYGDLESHDGVCRRLSDAGKFRVISVEYRLAPEHPFPAAVEDAIAAVNDIAANAEKYGADPARLAVGGDSAGANLSTVAARHMAKTNGVKLRFQLLVYPVVQSGEKTPSREKFADGYFLTKEAMDWFDGHYLKNGADPKDERLSPLLAPPPEGLAPALVITAGFDPLLDEGRAYAEALKKAGVRVDYVDYPDQIHGFFSFTAFSTVAADAIRDAALAVKAAIVR